MSAKGIPSRFDRPPKPSSARFPLFRDLGEDDLNRVLALGRTVAMEKGEIAIPQDTRCNEFYLTLSGAFSFRKSSPSGLVFELGKATAGEFFGENILLADHPSPVEVVAASQATVCIFRAADFRGVLGQHPSIARRMLDELTARINRFANLSFELATMKLDARLRRTIQDLARQANQLHDGGIIRPAPTHAELATMLGTTREVVSRSLILLSRNGAISTGRQQIHIRSVNLLCSEDGAFLS
jgi:CRP-like cAMP-binding protein